MKIHALKLKYEAEIEEMKIDIDNYLTNSVGVAEHPHIMESINGLIGQLAEVEDKLECLKNNFIVRENP
tara:strand:- start:137 stop:343 length:207 start_codon:yes stop_codon:yes gene_type:complete